MTTDCYHTELQFQGEPTRRKRASRRQRSPLPLLAQPLPIAARYIRRLTGVSPSTARLYAELAGFSMAGER